MQRQDSIHPNPKGYGHNMWKTWQMWHSKTGHLPQFGIENQRVVPVLQMWQKKKKNKGFVFLKRNVNFVGRKLIKSK